MLKSLRFIFVLNAYLATHALAADVPTPAALKASADYHRDAKGQTFLVLYDGKIIFEQYDAGGAADQKQLFVSGSKSFVGLAAVAAAGDGLLKFDDPASKYLPEWQADPLKNSITI